MSALYSPLEYPVSSSSTRPIRKQQTQDGKASEKTATTVARDLGRMEIIQFVTSTSCICADAKAEVM